MTSIAKSFLSNRSQFVSMNGFNSDHRNTECGVPHGSVLGPLLFLIFINDLNFAIRNSSTFHFADDTCFLNIKSTIKEINKYVNKDLRSLSKWLNAIKISLNFTKTEVLIFKHKGRVFDIDLRLKLCGKKLFTSKSVKYLGVILDECLQWNFHINQLCLKLNKANAMLCKIHHYVNETTLRSTDHAIFQSHLPYVCTAWGQNIKYNHRISILQRKTMRVIPWKSGHEGLKKIFVIDLIFEYIIPYAHL